MKTTKTDKPTDKKLFWSKCRGCACAGYCGLSLVKKAFDANDAHLASAFLCDLEQARHITALVRAQYWDSKFCSPHEAGSNVFWLMLPQLLRSFNAFAKYGADKLDPEETVVLVKDFLDYMLEYSSLESVDSIFGTKTLELYEKYFSNNK